MKIPKLTPRLDLIAEMVKNCEQEKKVVADIGTDHAKLPIFLVNSGICNFTYASDINTGPLEKAKENIKYFKCPDDKIKIVLSNGIEKIPRDYNILVIAGMGGELISDILENGKPDRNVTLILSPMTAAEELRLWLYKHNYSIVKEKIADEGKKIYTVIKAIFSNEPVHFEKIDCWLSQALLSSKNELVKRYIKTYINKQDSIINGKAQGGHFDDEYKAAIELKKLLSDKMN